MIEATLTKEEPGLCRLSVVVGEDARSLTVRDGWLKEADGKTIFCGLGLSVELNLPAEDREKVLARTEK